MYIHTETYATCPARPLAGRLGGRFVCRLCNKEESEDKADHEELITILHICMFIYVPKLTRGVLRVGDRVLRVGEGGFVGRGLLVLVGGGRLGLLLGDLFGDLLGDLLGEEGRSLRSLPLSISAKLTLSNSDTASKGSA